MDSTFVSPEVHARFRGNFLWKKLFLVLNLQILQKHMIVGLLRTLEEARVVKDPGVQPHSLHGDSTSVITLTQQAVTYLPPPSLPLCLQG